MKLFKKKMPICRHKEQKLYLWDIQNFFIYILNVKTN